MSLKAFYAELKKGLPAPAYIINADDAALLKEAVIEVRNTVPNSERDFKYHTFDLDSPDKPTPLEHIIDTLNTVPFMGGRQTVTLENLHKLNAADQKPLVNYMESPSPDTALVITYIGKPRKTLLTKLKGIKSISVGIMERDMPFWIKERAAKNDVELTKDAIEFLIGTVGADAGLLASEVAKLATLGKKRLNKDDIADLVTGGGDYSPFDLVEALKAGKADEAFRIYAVLQETQEPYGLLGVLNWHYGRLQMKPAQRTQVFKLLSDADLLVKSAGGIYPLEHLLAKLLRT
jgi:DNA polymerase III delta subunit